MKTPLVKINILSIYKRQGQRVLLPGPMNQCTADTKKALFDIKADLEKSGGKLYLSDLFRTYDMQKQAYLDYATGKKKAYSPPPGGSLHEAGRAFDLDLATLKISLADFWELAKKHGLSPIIDQPNPRASEAWHFECRGSHLLVYDYYAQGKGTNFKQPYKAMAASSILSIGQSVDMFGDKSEAAYIQSALIRLGKTIGNIDGDIGPNTRQALSELNLAEAPVEKVIEALDHLLQEKFPQEFFDATPLDGEGGA